MVRQKHFRRVRSAVAARLFAAKANFLPALIEIWGHVADLRAVSFCSANPNHLHTLEGEAALRSAGIWVPCHLPFLCDGLVMAWDQRVEFLLI